MRSRGVVAGLAVAALLLLPALASGAPTVGPRLTEHRVIDIAARNATVSDIVFGHPLAVWFGAYTTSAGWWVVSLREPDRPPLAWVTVRDRDGVVLNARKVSGDTPGVANLRMEQAQRLAGAPAKIRDWLARYTSHHLTVTTQTSYDPNGTWTRHWWSVGGEIARVTLNDRTRAIETAWIGPQVAWSMARGGDGFGKRINDPWVFGPMLALFALGLLDYRRLRSLRTLDVIALSGFSVSLWYFVHGEIFWSVPTVYPSLAYLLVRLVAIAFGRAPRPAYVTRWPLWVIATLAVFAMGFRGGLNAWSSNVIDVGYAGVAGSDRMLHGQSPYGFMPKPTAKPCGVKYSDGTYSAYVQPNGRCESPVEQGDTYGPVTYEAYAPFTAALGWSGRWDDLPAAHVTAVVFDALAFLGLVVAGWQIGGRRLAATLGFFWASYPFTLYAMSSNSNDAIVAAFLAWTFALFRRPFWRGVMFGLAALAKFTPVLCAAVLLRADRRPWSEPLEWEYSADGPRAVRYPGRVRLLLDRLRPGPGGARFALGMGLAAAVSFAILLPMEHWSWHLFYDRTFGFQLDRRSPFSIWDWGDYPGFPNLAREKRLLWIALVAASGLLYLVPRRLDITRVAALTGAVLVGIHIVLTHWFYLYMPWFIPSLAIALCGPRAGRQRR
jgi:hypothetical protein